MSWIETHSARHPRAWASALAALSLLEGWAMAKTFLSATFMPGPIAAHAGSLSFIVALLLASAVGYLIWHLLSFGEPNLTKIRADRWLQWSWVTLTAYMAILGGMTVTLVAFGADSAFGSILKGIRGVGLTNLDVKFWPLAFIAGVGVALLLARTIYLAMKKDLAKQTCAQDEVGNE